MSDDKNKKIKIISQCKMIKIKKKINKSMSNNKNEKKQINKSMSNNKNKKKF
jgi:hypothetical protein